ncbi:hypothetical protein [Streptomyces sp. NPDC127033]|uniref:hypothetical protein n=1 Tax=Streptomyces sp. NPDC127033 TaxID=3347110 RepID=UPI003667B041
MRFDAHCATVLTDGRSPSFADFGPALSSRFELSGTEAGFLGIATVLDRYARAAVVLDAFHHRPLTESKRTAFPRAASLPSAPTGHRSPRRARHSTLARRLSQPIHLID